MAFKCTNCKKGILYGHAVSHAKNRTKRIFKPNLQRLKVMRKGIAVRVTLCTSCIKRLKKDGRIGSFVLRKYTPIVSPDLTRRLVLEKKIEEEKKEKREEKKVKVEDKPKETLKVDAIVGVPEQAGKKN